MFGENPASLIFPFGNKRVRHEQGFVVAVGQRGTDPPDLQQLGSAGQSPSQTPAQVPSEEPALQPDATAGRGCDQKASRLLAFGSCICQAFPCKWPCVPPQTGTVLRKGPRATSSAFAIKKAVGYACRSPCSWGFLSDPTRVQGFLVLHSFGLIFKSVIVWGN